MSDRTLSALNPTIGVHSPLIFDIIGSRNGRSIGACTYHVGHPGGGEYHVLSVNAIGAQLRRIGRFLGYGHTPGSLLAVPDIVGLGWFYPEGHRKGPMVPPAEEINRERPFTLDLCRVPEI